MPRVVLRHNTLFVTPQVDGCAVSNAKHTAGCAHMRVRLRRSVRAFKICHIRTQRNGNLEATEEFPDDITTVPQANIDLMMWKSPVIFRVCTN